MSGTKFCPTNAQTNKGTLIGKGYESFLTLFGVNTPGFSYSRSTKHLKCAPTNIQGEALIPSPISLDNITAIAVADADQAKREICSASLQELSINEDILIAPDFYIRKTLPQAIQSGNRVTETIFDG